ncbi:Zinc finger CCCH domain-containing protein 3 [Vitis vinifera]|uniref:Zinc finger CCCH domain-containing protein 3 n=1 Tax=Vitis vinifera TaxID=29760 RepID=A0A438CFU9_VITVI|nr:Zinc finger CCCH domain-containing protein 3 [Vitis vinifera]
MPLGKYHCDYCDKQFQDTLLLESAISKVFSTKEPKLSGTTPSELSQQPNDPNQIQAEGYGKGVCNRFVRTGFCQYGDSCKYFHPKQSLQNTNTQSIPGNVVKDSMGNSWGNLPPSLKPPPEGGYPPLPFLDWG